MPWKSHMTKFAIKQEKKKKLWMEAFYEIIGSQKSKNKFAESWKHRPGDARDVNYETLSPKEKLFEIRRNTK